MPLFTLTCVDKPESLPIRLANRDAHLAYVRQLGERVLVGGPLLSDDGESMIGSLLIIDFADRAEADAFVAGDPYGQAGLFQSVTVRRYKKVLP